MLKRIILTALVIISAFVGNNAIANDVFVIKDIQAEATAKSAVAAREVAFKKALKQAFSILTHRMISKEQRSEFSEPSVDDISNMVLDFEITKEKSSRTSYQASYTVRFKKQDIRNFFSAQQVQYTDISGESLLVIPFLQTNNTTILWGENNAFLSSWKDNVINKGGLTKTIIPLGDLQDMIDIKDHEALSFKEENINALKSRYNAQEAIILIASPIIIPNTEKISALHVYIYKTSNNRPEYINTLTINGQNTSSLFKNAVKETKRFLQEEWKKKAAITSNQGNQTYKILVRYPTIDQWIFTKNMLEQNIGQNSVTVKSIRSNEAQINIKYSGNFDRLNLSLNRSGFGLRPVGAGFYEVYKQQ